MERQCPDEDAPSAAKRFKLTGTELMRRKAYRSHLLEKKPSTRTCRLGRDRGQAGRP